MSKWKVLFAGSSPDAPVHWRSVTDSGKVAKAGHGTLSEASKARAADTILLLPGTATTCLQIPLASRSEKQAREIVKYAVEDEIADDIDNVHVALLPSKAEPRTGHRTVFVTDKDWLQSWLTALDDVGITPHLVAPDYTCLPHNDGTLSVSALLDRVLLKTDDWGGAVSEDLGQTVLDAAISFHSNNGPIETVGHAPRSHWSQSILGNGEQADPMDLIAAQASACQLNLLQGAFSNGTDTTKFDWQNWRLPLGLAAAALITLSTVNYMQASSISSSERALRAESIDTFRNAFPQVERVVNPRAQLRTLTSSGSGQAEFLVLSATLSAGVEAVDAVTIDSIRYDDSRGALDASVLFNNYDDLSAFTEAVEAAGGVVEEGGSRQVGSRRSGDIRISLS